MADCNKLYSHDSGIIIGNNGAILCIQCQHDLPIWISHCFYDGFKHT